VPSQCAWRPRLVAALPRAPLAVKAELKEHPRAVRRETAVPAAALSQVARQQAEQEPPAQDRAALAQDRTALALDRVARALDQAALQGRAMLQAREAPPERPAAQRARAGRRLAKPAAPALRRAVLRAELQAAVCWTAR
jgi:hypothetical protein